MKKILLFIAMMTTACSSYAQDCSTLITTAGALKTQLNKTTVSDNTVNAKLWLSRNSDGYYLHISAINTTNNTPYNIKGLTSERFELLFADGNTIETRLVKKQTGETVVTLNTGIISAWAIMPVERISWFENNAMTPSLTLSVNNEASTMLSQVVHCLE